MFSTRNYESDNEQLGQSYNMDPSPVNKVPNNKKSSQQIGNMVNSNFVPKIDFGAGAGTNNSDSNSKTKQGRSKNQIDFKQFNNNVNHKLNMINNNNITANIYCNLNNNNNMNLNAELIRSQEENFVNINNRHSNENRSNTQELMGHPHEDPAHPNSQKVVSIN